MDPSAAVSAPDPVVRVHRHHSNVKQTYGRKRKLDNDNENNDESCFNSILTPPASSLTSYTGSDGVVSDDDVEGNNNAVSRDATNTPTKGTKALIQDLFRTNLDLVNMVTTEKSKLSGLLPAYSKLKAPKLDLKQDGLDVGEEEKDQEPELPFTPSTSLLNVVSKASSKKGNSAKVTNRVATTLSSSNSRQLGISSFFAPKRSKLNGAGTGLLSRPTSLDTEAVTKVAAFTQLPTSSIQPSTSKIFSKTTTPAIKRTEQLFLAFTPNTTKAASPSTLRQKSKSKPSSRYQCPQCGMPYIRGQPEDEQIHERYHRSIVSGIEYPGYKNEILVGQYPDVTMVSKKTSVESRLSFGGSVATSKIVVLTVSDLMRLEDDSQQQRSLHDDTAGHNNTSKGGSSSSSSSSSKRKFASQSTVAPGSSSSVNLSSAEKKKMAEILSIVNQDLGSIEFDPSLLEGCKLYLYISSKKKVVGCIVTERIRNGFEVMEAEQEGTRPTPLSTSDVTSTTTITARDSSNNVNSVVFCGTTPFPVVCGINRIWVSSGYRRQGIATRMLDAVRSQFVYGCPLQKADLAFSQPTTDGQSLAKSYLGPDVKFLVYVE